MQSESVNCKACVKVVQKCAFLLSEWLCFSRLCEKLITLKRATMLTRARGISIVRKSPADYAKVEMQ